MQDYPQRAYTYAQGQQAIVADYIAHSVAHEITPRRELVLRWMDWENRRKDALSLMAGAL